MSIEDIVKDYERLLKQESSISNAKDKKAITKTLKVGEWFRIDREVIEENIDEIYRQCEEMKTAGKKLKKRFVESNKIADQDPDKYSQIMEVLVFEHDKELMIYEDNMREMCEEIGDGMCDEVICDLELQMRICNGEKVSDLLRKKDKLPRVRIIQLRDGGTGYFGGGAGNPDENFAPADLFKTYYDVEYEHDVCVPYAFRRVISEH